MLFRKAEVDIPSRPFKIRIERQWKQIDVLALVGETHAIVIEDKIHAHEHGQQLKDYHQKAMDEFPDREIAFIYLKTGDEASHKSENWHSVGRSDLLATLCPAKNLVGNAILTDFIENLENRQESVRSFRTKPVDDWTGKDVYPIEDIARTRSIR